MHACTHKSCRPTIFLSFAEQNSFVSQVSRTSGGPQVQLQLSLLYSDKPILYPFCLIPSGERSGPVVRGFTDVEAEVKAHPVIVVVNKA